MPVVMIELQVDDAQEVASTIRTVVSKIDWVLENNPPRKPGDAERLDMRAKTLTIVAEHIETTLHQRALSEANNK
jgi:hypothetical protein